MPFMGDPSASIAGLLDTVRRLRGPGGCEWDRSQTVQSLRPFLLEEAFEVADAAAGGDWDSLRQELGDLLLHIVMDALIAEEQGRFDLSGVADGIREKLVRRHPHVFGSPEGLTPGQVEKQWERIKAGEKREEGIFASVPRSMPALQMAWRIQQRASDLGRSLPSPDESASEIIRPVDLAEVSDPKIVEDRIGRILFHLVNLSRSAGCEPEAALRRICLQFMEDQEADTVDSGTPAV